jgi:pyruvate/2-oxoglutarate dehydrogenase complex dihydrolipoamide dehydrogenase (E3) component
MSEFDLIVLGGGTGGLPSAVMAAGMGKKVAVVERDRLAGTCLNYGCTPTKSIVHSARVYAQAMDSRRFGIEFDGLRLDFKRVMERTRGIVSQALERNKKRVEDNDNITLFRGTGRFVSENEVEVGGETISADTFFIVTGASPFVPHIDGLDDVDYLTYRTVLDLDTLPESIVIIGGGFIGVEYASAFNAFGSKVTLIQRGDRLIGRSDGDVHRALAEYLAEDGVDVRFNTEAVKVDEGDDGVVLTTRDGGTLKAEKLMMTVGLRPNTPELNLNACGVEVDRRGFIRVDEYNRTTAENIWAFGDVVGRKMFTHAALKEFGIVVKNAFQGASIRIDETNLPYAVFTTPEMGSGGLTEEEAGERGLEFQVKKAYYADTSKGMVTGETRGFVKLIHDGTDILGCHAIGTDAGILVQEIAALMSCPGSLEAFRATTHTHPTLSEIFEDLK